MQEKLNTLRTMIRETFGGFNGLQIDVAINGDGTLTVSCFGSENYEQGTEFLRSLGIGRRQKTILDENTVNPWCIVYGVIGNDTVRVFCNGLPKSCRLEKYTERIPKQATVDTGEFIEVERTKVVCGANDLPR